LTAGYAGSAQLIEIYQWIDAKISVSGQFVAMWLAEARLHDPAGHPTQES
jgi:hypothetical protein